MANGQKSLAILNGLLVGGPFGALSAGVASSAGGDPVAAAFNSEVQTTQQTASLNAQTAAGIRPAVPSSLGVSQPGFLQTSTNAAGQTTFAGIPIIYLFLAALAGGVLLLEARR